VEGEGLADISLDEAQAGDVEVYRLHPALLDAATGFTSADLAEGHLPLSYRAVRVLAPLPAEIRSWGRGRSSGNTFSADVVVTGLDGEPLVEVEEFTKRRLEAGQGEADLAALEDGGDRSSVDPGFDPQPGLMPFEGAEALMRILGSRRHLSQVAVSSPVPRRATPAISPGRPAGPVPSVTDAGVEETLRRLWSEVLGVPEVGIHDNFFSLGGDSILGLQVVARARDAGLELTPGQIFEHQTVAQLAAVLRVESPRVEEAPAETGPGDFPLAEMDEAGLGQLFEQLAVIDAITAEDEP
jgi:aryl carrier-like protein